MAGPSSPLAQAGLIAFYQFGFLTYALCRPLCPSKDDANDGGAADTARTIPPGRIRHPLDVAQPSIHPFFPTDADRSF